jgi:hypothetical protein
MLSTPSMKSAGNQMARSIFVTPGNDVFSSRRPKNAKIVKRLCFQAAIILICVENAGAYLPLIA